MRWLKRGVNRDSESGEIQDIFQTERICYELDVCEKKKESNVKYHCGSWLNVYNGCVEKSNKTQ